MVETTLVKVILAIIAVLIAITFIQPTTPTAPFVADLKGMSLTHLLTYLLTYSMIFQVSMLIGTKTQASALPMPTLTTPLAVIEALINVRTSLTWTTLITPVYLPTGINWMSINFQRILRVPMPMSSQLSRISFWR